MQAIILAAGNSSRLFPFGGSTHKAALSFMGKSLIGRTIESLRSASIKDIIIIVSPENGIEKVLRDEKIDLTGISFVIHEGAEGMGEALLEACSKIEDDFVLVHAHHFECGQFLPGLFALKSSGADGAIVVKKEPHAASFGVVTFEGEKITSVMEKPENASEVFRIVGIYLLSKTFLTVLQEAEKHHYSFETALNEFVKKKTVLGLKTEEQTITLKFPWHILDISSYLLNGLKAEKAKKVTIAESAILEGEIIISEGVVIEAGAVIKGPCYLGENVYIGTNAIIRGGTILEKNVVIGANMEIKHSVLMQGATTHSGYIGDSVIGNETKIAALFCTGNVRIDRENVQVVVKGQKVDSGKKSLGSFIGNKAKIGIRVSTMPGVLIGHEVIIGPSTTVFKNLNHGTHYYVKITEIVEQEGKKKNSKNLGKQKLVLFDIDYTLFDTKTFKDSGLKTFSVFSEVLEAIGEIGAYADLGVFSEGEVDFQKSKLFETAIVSHFHPERIHIVEKKADALSLLDQYNDYSVFVVDDRLEVLSLVKKHNRDLFTIWMKRGPFALEQKPILDFTPDAIIDDLRMVLPIVAGME